MASPAGGSGGRDVQQHLLTLIRGFATEKSQGERRVSDLKKRLIELQAELEDANSGLEVAKGQREATEGGLKGSEVELSMTDASVIALETRTRLLQEEVSKATSGLAALKNEEGNLRDQVINQMRDLNKKIRHFREIEVASIKKKGHAVFTLDDSMQMQANPGKTMKDEKPTVQDKISDTNVQLNALEQKYREELSKQDEILQMLADMEKRAFLGESIIEETKQLHELARQTSESEKVYATVGIEIQKRFTCPSCQVNNMGVLERSIPAGGEDE